MKSLEFRPFSERQRRPSLEMAPILGNTYQMLGPRRRADNFEFVGPNGGEDAIPTLATIGYEGKTQGEFLGELEEAGIEVLIDVRAVAASRRPGFSKTALAGALRERSIDYLHLRALGTPAAGREAARKGRVAEMRAIYADQLETPEAAFAFEQVLAAAVDRRAALLCYEREAAGCHRSMLAERMIERAPFEIVNL